MRTVASSMEQSEVYEVMLSEIDILLKIYSTASVTMATVEHFFLSPAKNLTIMTIFVFVVHTQSKN